MRVAKEQALPDRQPPAPPKTILRTISSSYSHRSSSRNGSSSWLRFLSTLGTVLILSVLLMNMMVLTRMSLLSTAAGGDPGEKAGDTRRLAVVVPAHDGDLKRALQSLSRWPTACSPTTLRHVELLLYYAGAADDGSWSEDVVLKLERTGGKCFSRTSVVFGNLTDEEDVYPKGPSVQFYKLFLEENLRARLSSFDAIAIIDWDVLVAHDQSFERLHQAAFDGVEPFWVKGSTLAGTNFHGTATITDHWKVLGHLNGNAIYNNSDPAFVEFINFTLARWNYDFSYDVALWATIADFPYSWPLWQRFSSKFVTTNLVSAPAAAWRPCAASSAGRGSRVLTREQYSRDACLIANFGFLDVDPQTVDKAVASETMFIHGSISGGGGRHFASDRARAAASAPRPGPRLSGAQCRPECGRTAVGDGNGGLLSTVCDPNACSSPVLGNMDVGGEDERSLCGAGDEDRYGRHCRVCYTDVHEALRAERRLSTRGQQAGGSAGKHVIMCDTLRPPQSPNCHPKCAAKLDTICDHRCGSGIFRDYNCNWRNRGAHCRHCFDDLDAAITADKAAKRTGGRVIMCSTHEPPAELTNRVLNAFEQQEVAEPVPAAEEAATGAEAEDRGGLPDQGRDAADDANAVVASASMLPYAKDLVRGEICAYTTGYFVFLAETEASVRSFQHFMPGVRVRVAVDPVYFSVFNRTLGAYPGVAVVNATTVGGHASLLADVHCGEGTKLIYYLGPGEVIPRAFTKKDTHSTGNKLLVLFTELERLDESHLKRARATTALLGFRSPSFSYGADLVLPAWINRRLRHLLVTGARPTLGRAMATEASALGGGAYHNQEQEQEQEQEQALSLVIDTEDAYVPELLAALAYSQNPPGIWFLNPQQWVTHHMFQPASIWDIPLVKPRMGCSTPLALVASGYDVAHELNSFIDYNSHDGADRSCQTGFMHLDPSKLRKKDSVEFGSPASNNLPMPDIADLRVSLLYGTADAADAWLLNVTLPTVLNNFPAALEAVVVVENEAAAGVYRSVFDHHQTSAGFDLTVIVEERLAAAADGGGEGWGGAKQRLPLLWADKHCSGSFVLHLEVDSVLLRQVTYDDIFHFGKPVIPFTRLTPEDVSQQQPGTACWRAKGSQALDLSNEKLVHDFSAYDTHVYPIALYTRLRAHLRTAGHWEGSLKEVMEAGTCEGAAAAPTKGQEAAGRRRRFRREMQFNLMATFMWYYMHRRIHWSAIDPLDIQPDEWPTDPQKYRTWSCNLGAILTLTAESSRAAAATLLRRGVAGLESVEACEGLGARVNAERLKAAAAAPGKHEP